jgi:hypothetical protein
MSKSSLLKHATPRRGNLNSELAQNLSISSLFRQLNVGLYINLTNMDIITIVISGIIGIVAVLESKNIEKAIFLIL